MPITRVVTKLDPGPNSLANPKSDTLGFHRLSRRMLLDLISRCTTLGSNPSCKYAILKPYHHQEEILVFKGNKSVKSLIGIKKKKKITEEGFIIDD